MNIQTFHKNKIKPLHFSPLSLLFLAACGGSSDNASKQNFSGFVIKGPLHNATVFADYDGDGVKDSNEPFALTNSDGSYT